MRRVAESSNGRLVTDMKSINENLQGNMKSLNGTLLEDIKSLRKDLTDVAESLRIPETTAPMTIGIITKLFTGLESPGTMLKLFVEVTELICR